MSESQYPKRDLMMNDLQQFIKTDMNMNHTIRGIIEKEYMGIVGLDLMQCLFQIRDLIKDIQSNSCKDVFDGATKAPRKEYMKRFREIIKEINLLVESTEQEYDEPTTQTGLTYNLPRFKYQNKEDVTKEMLERYKPSTFISTENDISKIYTKLQEDINTVKVLLKVKQDCCNIPLYNFQDVNNF